MPEKLYQLPLSGEFGPQAGRQEVTPPDFSGLQFPQREAVSRFPAPIEAENNLGLGRFVRETENRVYISEPAVAAGYFMENVFSPFETVLQEELWSMLLDTKNQCRYLSMIYRGNLNSAIVRAAEVFRDAIVVNSSAMILAHNHPSGEVNPSPEDVRVTQTLHQAGQLLGIELLDHLIIGQDQWASLKERGLGFD